MIRARPSAPVSAGLRRLFEFATNDERAIGRSTRCSQTLSKDQRAFTRIREVDRRAVAIIECGARWEDRIHVVLGLRGHLPQRVGDRAGEFSLPLQCRGRCDPDDC